MPSEELSLLYDPDVFGNDDAPTVPDENIGSGVGNNSDQYWASPNSCFCISAGSMPLPRGRKPAPGGVKALA